MDKKDLPNAVALNSIQFNVARVLGPLAFGATLAAAAHYGFERPPGDGRVLRAQRALVSRGDLDADVAARAAHPAREHDEHARRAQGRAGLRARPQRDGRAHRPRGDDDVSGIFGADVPAGLRAERVSRRRGHLQPSARVFRRGVASSARSSSRGSASSSAWGSPRSSSRRSTACSSSAFALSQTLWMSDVLLFFTGATLMVVFSTVTSLVQLIAPNEMRGRVMSIYMRGVPRRHAARQPHVRLLRDDLRRARSSSASTASCSSSSRRISCLSSSHGISGNLMPVLELITSSGFGSLLGMRHALEPDHLAAVSTLVSRERNQRQGGVSRRVLGARPHVLVAARRRRPRASCARRCRRRCRTCSSSSSP